MVRPASNRPRPGRRAIGHGRGRRATHSSLRICGRWRPPDIPAAGDEDPGQRSPAADEPSAMGDPWAARRPRGHRPVCDLLPGRAGPLAGEPAAATEREPAANRARVSGAAVSGRPPGRAGPTGRLGGAPGQRRALESGCWPRTRVAGVRPRPHLPVGSGGQLPGDAEGAAEAPGSCAGGGVIAGIGGLDGTGPPRVGYVWGIRIP